MSQNRHISTVALFGATGNLGSHILRALLEAQFIVTVILRPNSKFQLTTPSIKGVPTTALRAVKIPFDDEQAMIRALRTQDAVVVSVSKGGIQTQKNIIHAAVLAGVKRFIPSEFGADTLNDSFLRDVPALQEKRVILDYLKAAARDNPWFTWTGISNAAFIDWGLESGFLGFDITRKAAVIYSSGTKRFNATTRPTVGKAVALALKRPETENKYMYICDFATTQNELLELLEVQSGCNWEVTAKDAYQHRKEGETLFQQGNFASAAAKLLLGNLLGEGHGTLMGDELLANAALGLETKDIHVVVGEALSKAGQSKS